MKWITRERPKIDRIACPWLVKNFVDKEAEFVYVPKEQVFSKAIELGTLPYEIPGAQYSHEGNFCTFDYILKKHELNDPALHQMAVIVGERIPTVLIWHLTPENAGQYPQGCLSTLKTTRNNFLSV
jgi:hypothetical protein